MIGQAQKRETIASDGFSVVGSTAVPDLAARQVERQAIQFLALRQIALERRERVPPYLLHAMDAVMEAPSETEVNQVLFRLPHIRQWCLTLKDFLLFNLGAEGVVHRMEIHAAELDRLLLSASVRTRPKEVHHKSLVIHPSGSVHLPGTGWMGRFVPDAAGQKASIRFEDGKPCFVEALCNRIGFTELWSTDMLVRRPGSRTYTFPVEDDEEIRRWDLLIQDYKEEVAEHWPAFYKELPYLLQGVVAVETPSGETHLSGTFAEVPGAIYLSWADSLEVIKEAITHELFHTRLNLLIDSEFFDRSFHGEDLFWAPWRFQVRPTIPFIHGVYAHYGMMLHNHLLSRHRPEKTWRSKLATHLIRLTISEVQWFEALKARSYPQLLLGVMEHVMSEFRQVLRNVQSDLRDELLVAAAGEMGELKKYSASVATPVFFASTQKALNQLLREIATT